MMVKYETLMLARTEITDDELSSIENHFDKVCSDSKGKLAAFDKWGKYQLAYPVKKNSYGVYILARYELPSALISEIFKNIEIFLKIKCQDTVLRHVTIKLAADAPIAYLRPDPLDSNRSGGIDAMLKEGKIENLLDSVESSTKKSSIEKNSSESSPEKSISESIDDVEIEDDFYDDSEHASS
ncbi:MAG: 30S ribosomal protein S6 [bacterium]